MDRKERIKARIAIYKRIDAYIKELGTIHADAQYFLTEREVHGIYAAEFHLRTLQMHIHSAVFNAHLEDEREYIDMLLRMELKE